MAAVNGVAHGLGVTLLPLFDVVFASDKATFATDYANLGQIPEALGNHTLFQNKLALSKMLVFGKTMTAQEAVQAGFVSDLVWPDKFLEVIVPKMEQLDEMPLHGLNLVKRSVMNATKARLTASVIDEETKELIKCWTTPKFAKRLRLYLKQNHYTFH